MSSASFVHGIGGLAEEDLAWLRRVVPVLNTPWGPAAVVNGPRRRKHNIDLVNRIIENEMRCIETLRQAVT